MRCLVVALAFFGTASAFRVKPKAKANVQVSAGDNKASKRGNTVDATSLIAGKEKDGIKCCCDAKSDNNIQDNIFNQGRTGRCGMLLTKDFKCSTPVTQPAWAADRTLRHYVHSVKKCMVDPEDIQEIYTKYGSPPGYCLAIVHADGSEIVGAAAMNTDMPVSCPAGEYSTIQTTKCLYMSVENGAFDAQPTCVKAEEWCPPSSISEDEYWNYLPWYNGAPLNGAIEVSCAVGSVPANAPVTCGADKQFHPAPACNKVMDFCSAVDSSDSKSGAIEQAAAYGEHRQVVCYSPGYIPYDPWVICSVNEDGFTPEYRTTEFQSLAGGLHCFKEQEYCPGIEADQLEYIKGRAANVDPAEINQQVMVRCREGSNPNQFEVQCGTDQKYHPEPTCTKISDWCPSEESQGEDGLFVFQAGRDEASQVQCGQGWHPEKPTVVCGRSHQFDPKPSCVND